MPVNTLTHPLKKGDLLLICSGPGQEGRIAIIWEIPYIRRRATRYNVRILETFSILGHETSADFLQTGLARQIRETNNAEEAVATFKRAVDSRFWDPNNKEAFEEQAKGLRATIGRGGFFNCKPSAEAVRKDLLGGACPNPHCYNGFVAATHRAALYEEFNLPTTSLHEDRKGVGIQCPACMPKDLVIENEKQILVALRVDAGGEMTTTEYSAMQAHDKQLNERRFESGNEEFRFACTVVFVVYGNRGRRPAWMTRFPGEWLERMRLWSDQDDDNGEVSTAAPAPNVPTRKFGDLKRSVNEAQCGICLIEDFGDGDDVALLPCLHFFHGGCITPWLGQHPSCPACRQPVTS